MHTDYKIGVIGLGHWFNRLNVGMQMVGGLSLAKAMGTKPYEEKRELLSGFKLGKEDYYITDETGHIPEGFFDGIDVVHVSDPNSLHALQTEESLLNGKYVVTEKSFATTEGEFERISSMIKRGNYEDKAYLHLHYLHKQPTLILKAMLPGLVKRHGKIKNVSATFFERENEEDARRGKWLFSLRNGGIFMDWIHPFEILYYATESDFDGIRELKEYSVNYETVNPTGIKATINVGGKYYLKDASATISVAKGVGEKEESKSIRIEFDSGSYATLGYVGSEIEFKSDDRGMLEIGEVKNGKNRIMMASRLQGPNSSEIFVDEIIGLCNGENTGLTMDEVSAIFKPQWEYQKLTGSGGLIKERDKIDMFVKDGISSAGGK